MTVIPTKAVVACFQVVAMGSWVRIQKKRAGVFVISLSLLLFSTSLVYGQWASVNPPSISTDWYLYSIHLASPTEGWAVGGDNINGGGVLLNYSGGTWSSVTPPSVTSKCDLYGVHFTSATEGWAVGQDWTDQGHYVGVLFHYSGGAWTSVTTPPLGSAWWLDGVHLTSTTEGWAVGTDGSYPGGGFGGLLLHYSGGTWTLVAPPPVSPSWMLRGVHFTSATEGWAIGYDWGNDVGLLLHYSGGTWTSVTPPSVSPSWSLKGVHFTSPTEGWAVGGTFYTCDDVKCGTSTGVLLHYSGGKWTSVTPPSVSLTWGLNKVHFTSPTEGWAIGGACNDEKCETRTGVLLHYSGGTWTSVAPPPVSTDWYLIGVHFTSGTEGWAVGYDNENGRGLLLKYSEDISTPETPVGPFNGVIGISYNYSTGGAISNHGDPVQYLFDWGDGSNSGWLPVGKLTASKSWSSVGTYIVRVQARCSIHPSLVSFSDVLTVNIEPPTITLGSPLNGDIFNSCSLIIGYQPKFTWTANGAFTKITILFSTSLTDFTAPIVKLSFLPARNSWTPWTWLWRWIMRSSNNNGSIRDIYWKVVGTTKDMTLWESEVRSFTIGTPEAVIISTPLDGAILNSATLPTFDFSTNCNTRFRLEISSLKDFSVSTKIRSFSFTVWNPNLTTSLQKTLSPFQSTVVKKMIGTGAGYFRIKSWDALSRPTVSEIRSFTIQ